MRRVCFRFDVDTHRCLKVGVPALREIARRTGVPFSFLVNMGRSTSRLMAVASLVRGGRAARRSTEQSVLRLPTLRKLGVRGVAEVLVANPLVGARGTAEIRRLVEAGHEVGLHGGRNHRVWQQRATGWPESRVRDELAWGLDRLATAGVAGPVGFSSPGWTRPDGLASNAGPLGISYVADIHDPAREGVDVSGPVAEVVTNIVGEPGGVGYLEWMRASGAGDDEIVADLVDRLRRVRSSAVVYDHPYWAGVHEADLVERLVHTARAEGFEVCTLATMVDDARSTA